MSRTQMEAVIVENDLRTRAVLTAALTSLGYQVLNCATEAEVRGALADSQGLVIFLSLDEARETRLAFCRWLRAEPGNGTAWVVALTCETELIEPAVRAGASDVVLKPVDRSAALARAVLATREM